jgi:hypothetical protein
MVTIDEIYEYIRSGNVEKVQEYLDRLVPSGSIALSKLNNFMSVAINFKQLKVIQLLVAYGASIQSLNNVNMVVSFERGDLDIYNYLLNGRTYQEYMQQTDQETPNGNTPYYDASKETLFPPTKKDC